MSDENIDAKLESLEDAEKCKELGNAAYKARRFDEAIKCYNKAAALDPTKITYLTNEAAVHFEMHQYEKCIEVCHRAIEVGQEHRADFKLMAKAYARIGNAYQRMDDMENAKKFFDKSLTEFRAPDIVKKAQEAGKLLKERQDAEYVNPELADAEKEAGNKLFTAGKYPEAMKRYTEAIRRNPKDAKIYSNRAACYMKLMEFHSALKDCDKCIELDPKFIKGYLRKGACLKALKDPIKAGEAYRKAVELDPKCAEATDGLRQCSYSSNDPEAVRQRAMHDPEVQQILNDPAMQMILSQMQKDPQALRDHLQNPDIAAKIQKLMEIGLISLR